AAPDVIAEVDVGQVAADRLLEQAQDVPGARGAVPLGGVVEEVNGRQPPGGRVGQGVDVADPDQPAAQEVAPLLDPAGGALGVGVVDETVGVTAGVLGGVLGPALVPGLVGVVA